MGAVVRNTVGFLCLQAGCVVSVVHSQIHLLTKVTDLKEINKPG